MTNNIPQETINSVLIDILKGAKDAGHEIYGASKTGIVKAVEFAQEQSPMVVQEFLMWKYAQGIIYTVIAVIGLGALLWIANWCRKYINKTIDGSESDGNEVLAGLGMVISLMASACVLFNVLVPNIEQMVKVKVAPRVFIIEWVSDQVTGKK